MTAVESKLRGADGIAAVAAAVRRAGTDRTIVKAMDRRIQDWGRLPAEDIRIAFIRRLPHEGGLNDWMARASVRAKMLRGVRSAGVRLVTGRKHKGKTRMNASRLDRHGIVRAPSWGRRARGEWHEVRVPKGIVTDAVEQNVDEFRDRIDEAVAAAWDRVAGEVNRRG